MMTREEAIEELERLLSHWDDLENGKRSFRWYSKDAVEVAISALSQPNEPLTCEGCACESYPRDCYPCNTCSRNDETLSDQYRPPEGEADA